MPNDLINLNNGIFFFMQFYDAPKCIVEALRKNCVRNILVWIRAGDKRVRWMKNCCTKYSYVFFFLFSDVEDEKAKERSFVKVFFLTYHWYISAKDLMKKFIELYLFL